MILDLLLNIRNLVLESMFAPLDVTSHFQPESVEVGEAWDRNNNAVVSQVWIAAVNKRIAAHQTLVPQIFVRNI